MRYGTEKRVILKGGEACVLRSPGKEDAGQMVDYVCKTTGETCYLMRYPDEITLTVEKEAELLEAAEQAPGRMMIAAFVDGELAGNVEISGVTCHFKTKHRADIGIAVLKKYWSMGVGTALVEAAIEAARRMEYSQLELGVFSDNERAQALYKKYGFEEWGRIRGAYRLRDGTFHDEILMGKQLLRGDNVLNE